MATQALPLSVPDGDELRSAGLAFAEGRDSLPGSAVAGLALRSMPGNVGFVRAAADCLAVVRSGPGTVPWYGWQDGERALVSTSFTELVNLLPVAPELDTLVCTLWASANAVFPGGRSFLRGVTVIPPGHTADVAPGRPISSRPWWNPWPEELPWPSRIARADHVERFRHAVLTGLEREVAEEPVNLLTLSGGVDSSALAYLVRRHLVRPLAALSFVPPSGAPEGPLEASYLDPLVADLGIAPHRCHPLNNAERMSLFLGAPPVAFPVLHPALQVMAGVVEEWGVEVLVGGEFADEICGGWFALPDWLDAVSLPRLLSQLGAMPRGRADVRAWAVRRKPGRVSPGPWVPSLPEWVRPEVEEEYQTWRAEEWESLRASSAPYRYQQAVLAWLDGALAMNWEVCSFLKIRRAFPFLTAETLEVVSACHPVELLGPGPKRLERQAFSDLVPHRYLHRPDKSGWAGGDDDVLVDPPLVSAPLGAMLREDLASMAPAHAIGVSLMDRFVRRVCSLA
jgi:asparagine synthetase B (glutamine-hydrolysing)